MTIGSRIKKIREFRKLSQKELGIKCGFNETNADVRIRQYESDKKIPREENLKILSRVLGISNSVLMPSTPIEELIETLFWAEEIFGDFDLFSFRTINEAPKNEFDPGWKYDANYNKYDRERLISNVTIGIATQNAAINDCLKDWLKEKNKLELGDITAEEYFEWKINWPESVVVSMNKVYDKKGE